MADKDKKPTRMPELLTSGLVSLMLQDLIELDFDPQKIEDAVLASLLLNLHERRRVWKTYDWAVLDRLYVKGYISDPSRPSMSVALTDSGFARATKLFGGLFAP